MEQKDGHTNINGMMGYMLERAWFESMEENRQLMEKLMVKKLMEEGIVE